MFDEQGPDLKPEPDGDENAIKCPKCDGPARYLVNVETGTTLLCPRCPHAWTIDQKDDAP